MFFACRWALSPSWCLFATLSYVLETASWQIEGRLSLLLFKRYLPLKDCEAEGGIVLMDTIWYYKSFTWGKILISIIEKWPHSFIISVDVSCHSVFIAPIVKVYGSSPKGCPWIWHLMTSPSTEITASNWSSLDLFHFYAWVIIYNLHVSELRSTELQC